MEKRNKLVLQILRELQDRGVLHDIVLIGSWCQYFYRSYFNNAPEIPVVRTLDLDFLIPNPPKITNEIDIPEILKHFEFEPVTDYLTGYTRYVHPDLEVEFLIPELGRGKSKPYEIKDLKINAQGLRFLNLLQQYVVEISTEDITIKVPEPSAYILHKFLISGKRVKESKKERDILSAKEIGEFLIQDENQRSKMLQIFNSLPRKWRNRIETCLKENSLPIYNHLFVDVV